MPPIPPPLAVGKHTLLPLPGFVTLRFDGACYPNPGPMGIGYTLETEKQHGEAAGVLAYAGTQIGQGTNNEAEYRALLAGLRHAIRLGAWQLRIESDSMLVVQQVKGEWKIKKGRLRQLRTEVVSLLNLLPMWSIHHIPREENEVADRLSHTVVLTEPLLPLPSTPNRSRVPRKLLPWQAAFVRVGMLKGGLAPGVFARIFKVSVGLIEGIERGESYREATFEGVPDPARLAFTGLPDWQEATQADPHHIE